MRSTWGLLLAVGALAATVLAARGFTHGTPAAVAEKADPPVPAVLGVAQAENVPVYLTGIGTVTPIASVTIKVRVDGQLERVAFVEGQDVKAGDLLAQIDPRPYKAAVEQAQAQKARDEAQLSNALVDLQRYETLLKEDSIQKQVYDTQVALVQQLRATAQADQAQIDTARVNLGYTTIRSPVTGRTGVRLVDPGNIVHATDTTGLVVVNQIDPIAVLFTLPEENFQRINAAINTSGHTPLAVRALSREEGKLLAMGKLLLVNNQIDAATGTVQLKASFPNAQHVLWPGQYVSAQLVLGERRSAVTVPASVVQRGPEGLYAYVVKTDSSVAVQPLRVALIQDGKAVIEEGLSPGTRVVVDGQYKLKPGVKVTDVRRGSAAAGSGAGATTADGPTTLSSAAAPGAASLSAAAAGKSGSQ